MKLLERYVKLSKERFLHEGNYLSDSDFEKIYSHRINSVSALKTELYPLLTNKQKIQSNQYPIFLIFTRKLVERMEYLRRNSDTIRRIATRVPRIAQDQFKNSLLLDEITYTNRIEGVQTNEYEISTLINQATSKKVEKKQKEYRLKSSVRLYIETQNKGFIKIQELNDFRKIYDQLLDGEISEEKLPNGKIFRDVLPHNVLRIGTATETVHQPPVTEEEISRALNSLIMFMNNESIPAIIRALITHFFFENTHPFLDGNGRMGRFLLSTYLSRKYDSFTGLSVSTAIHERQQSHYRIFKEADQTENRAELTFFIEDFLKILLEQQEHVIEVLTDDDQKLSEMYKKIKKIATSFEDKEAAGSILFLLAQSKLFTVNTQLGIKDSEIIRINSENKISMNRSRRMIDLLEEKKLIEKISSRPKQHILNYQ
ncbi:Fic family protein [Lactobacillus johnsonii]|uniref:Fic family protein n=1 Tax=Lactobacillus johnsonii TaxID=33959 RepID=UPI0028E688A7|nr:Fic family protein [Lactobacillus johnsonii]MDT9606433.1 Fic family protein [Lactobacillus johnsonii]